MRRREFLHAAPVALAAAATAAGLSLPAACGSSVEPAPFSVPDLPGVVAVGRLTPGEKGAGISVRDGLQRAVEKLAGCRGPDAWRRFFSARDTVGIKVNALAPALAPCADLVKGIVDGLRSAGVPDSRILIWDRTTRELEHAGFAAERGSGVRCFGTDEVGYDETPQVWRSMGSCFSRIVSTLCTALVSVPVLKDHDLAGVSLGLKNYYGAIHNPNKYHGGNCNPYVAELFTHPYLQGKHRLTIIDGIRAQCHGGPAFSAPWTWPLQAVAVTRDPVSADAWGADLIDRQRKVKGLAALAEEKRAPVYIRTAEGFGLGVGDPARIKVEEA